MLSNKSVCQISALLELPRSTVVVKWKCLGPTTWRSGRPHKLTEHDCQVLKRVKITCPWLQASLPSSKLPLEATSAQALFVERFMKWVSMAKQPHTSLRSLCAMPSVNCSGVKLTALGTTNCEPALIAQRQCPTSLMLVVEWKQVPAAMIQHLVENLPEEWRLL